MKKRFYFSCPVCSREFNSKLEYPTLSKTKHSHSEGIVTGNYTCGTCGTEMSLVYYNNRVRAFDDKWEDRRQREKDKIDKVENELKITEDETEREILNNKLDSLNDSYDDIIDKRASKISRWCNTHNNRNRSGNRSGYRSKKEPIKLGCGSIIVILIIIAAVSTLFEKKKTPKVESTIETNKPVSRLDLTSTKNTLNIENAIAPSPTWGPWAKANSIAKKGAWRVIRQPLSRFCYINQGHHDNTGFMELSMKKDKVPLIILPYFGGVTGNLTYRIDQGKLYRTKTGDNPIKLPKNTVSEMLRGKVLVVKIKPKNSGAVIQKFDLTGFKYASQYLNKPACKKYVKDKYYKR